MDFELECLYCCTMNGWDRNKITDFAREKGVSYELVVSTAKKRIVRYSNGSEDLFNLYKVSTNGKKVYKDTWLKKWLEDSDKRKKYFKEKKCNDGFELKFKLCEDSFNEFVKVNFNIKKLKTFADSLDLKVETVKNYAEEYYKQVFGNTHDEWLEFIKTENSDDAKFIKWVNSSKERKHLYELLGGGEYKEFRNKLAKHCYEYAERFEFNIKKIKAYCEIYDLPYVRFRDLAVAYAEKVLHIYNLQFGNPSGIYALPDDAKKFEEIKSKNKLTDDDIRKLCFEYCDEINFDFNKMCILASNLGVSYLKLTRFVREYMIDVLGLDYEECNDRMFDEVSNRKACLKWIGKSEKRRKFYELIGKDNYYEFIEELRKICYQYRINAIDDIDKMELFCSEIDITFIEFFEYSEMYSNKLKGDKINVKRR